MLVHHRKQHMHVCFGEKCQHQTEDGKPDMHVSGVCVWIWRDPPTSYTSGVRFCKPERYLWKPRWSQVRGFYWNTHSLPIQIALVQKTSFAKISLAKISFDIETHPWLTLFISCWGMFTVHSCFVAQLKTKHAFSEPHMRIMASAEKPASTSEKFIKMMSWNSDRKGLHGRTEGLTLGARTECYFCF